MKVLESFSETDYKQTIMTFHPLSDEQKKDLELHHRYEGDGRVRDRIKAILLKSEGWTNKAIAQALRIHEETVRQHLTEWTTDKKLKPENGGSYSKLYPKDFKLMVGDQVSMI